MQVHPLLRSGGFSPAARPGQARIYGAAGSLVRCIGVLLIRAPSCFGWGLKYAPVFCKWYTAVIYVAQLQGLTGCQTHVAELERHVDQHPPLPSSRYPEAPNGPN